jgi:hydroxymethylbilane synthase
MNLRLGTRGSRLALFQAELIRERLEERHPGLAVEIQVIQTTGDRITDVPLAKIGDKGVFTKELDRAILAGEVDAAVHSLKDMPTVLVPGLDFGAVLDREDPRDVLIPAPGRPAKLADYPAGSRIGTSSLRRRAQLLHLRPDLQVVDLRGNLDTRFARLQEGYLDAAILAHAGVARLEREAAIGEILEAPPWLPAPGQGALGIAVREGDYRVLELFQPLDDPAARMTTSAERGFLRALEGGCQIPIGALAISEGEELRLQGLVSSIDGTNLLRGELVGNPDAPEELGQRLAEELLGRGAGEILSRIRSAHDESLPSASAP